VSLSGYGVELAIKSTEYKAIDDANVKDNASGEEEGTNKFARIQLQNFPVFKFELTLV
jgi:hypothetical protein